MNAKISDECAGALQRGDKIAAIKLVRRELGLDLAAAKDWVDRYPHNTRSVRPSLTKLPGEAVNSLNDGDLIGAVRLVREATGLGLKESKDAVDAFLRDNQSIRAQFEERRAPRRQRKVLGLIAVVLAIAAAVYFR
jgi:ribosomal protein L7/L12